MALPTASDNIFPKLILDEGGTLGTVTAGERRLGIDANGVLVWKNSAGVTSPLVALNKWDATAAPAVTDDSGDGYQPGSRWIDLTNDKEYVCLDAAVGAAVWTETTAAGGGGGGTPTFVGAKAYHNTTQSIPNNATTGVELNTEEFDSDAFHSTASNTSRFTVPSGKGGYYLLLGGTSGAAALQAGSEFLFRKNGTTLIHSAHQGQGVSGWVITSAIANLAATDYVELVIYQNSGGALNIGHATNIDNQSWASVALLGT